MRWLIFYCCSLIVFGAQQAQSQATRCDNDVTFDATPGQELQFTIPYMPICEDVLLTYFDGSNALLHPYKNTTYPDVQIAEQSFSIMFGSNAVLGDATLTFQCHELLYCMQMNVTTSSELVEMTTYLESIGLGSLADLQYSGDNSPLSSSQTIPVTSTAAGLVSLAMATIGLGESSATDNGADYTAQSSYVDCESSSTWSSSRARFTESTTRLTGSTTQLKSQTADTISKSIATATSSIEDSGYKSTSDCSDFSAIATLNDSTYWSTSLQPSTSLKSSTTMVPLTTLESKKTSGSSSTSRLTTESKASTTSKLPTTLELSVTTSSRRTDLTTSMISSAASVIWESSPQSASISDYTNKASYSISALASTITDITPTSLSTTDLSPCGCTSSL